MLEYGDRFNEIWIAAMRQTGVAPAGDIGCAAIPEDLDAVFRQSPEFVPCRWEQ